MLLIIKILINLLFGFPSQICGEKNPKIITDCTYDSYVDQACCLIDYNNTNINNELTNADTNLMELNNKAQKGCLFIPQNSTFITPFINYLDFGLNYLFHITIDCGKNEDKVKRVCEINPIVKEDCFYKSNSTHDCCYFQTPNKTICLWNNVLFRKNSHIFGTNISCFEESSMDYLKLRNIYSLTIFLFLSLLL